MKALAGGVMPARRKLPDERRSITHKFSHSPATRATSRRACTRTAPRRDLRGHGEGRLDDFGGHGRVRPSISMALQYGVPLEALVEKFAHVRYEPSGFTTNPEIHSRRGHPTTSSDGSPRSSLAPRPRRPPGTRCRPSRRTKFRRPRPSSTRRRFRRPRRWRSAASSTPRRATTVGAS